MDPRNTGRTVVVGVDGSEGALQAVRWAAGEAGRLHLPLRLVNAFGWTTENVAGLPAHGSRYRGVLLERAHGLLATATAVAKDQTPGLQTDEQVVVGFPVGVLSAEARRAELLVLGGSSRIEGLLAGSVVVALAANAACPVVVVRGRELSADAARLPVVVGVDGSPTSEAAIAFAFAAAAARKVPLVAVHA